MELKMFNKYKGNRQKDGRGQAKCHNQIRVQEVQRGRHTRCQGRQYGQAGGFRVMAGKGQKGGLAKTEKRGRKKTKKKQAHGITR